MAEYRLVLSRKKRVPLTSFPCSAHQIIDTGLDETSCYFSDEDGQQVDHGYFFDELSDGSYYVGTGSDTISKIGIFEGGDFSFDSSRRKVRISRDSRLGGGFLMAFEPRLREERNTHRLLFFLAVARPISLYQWFCSVDYTTMWTSAMLSLSIWDTK